MTERRAARFACCQVLVADEHLVEGAAQSPVRVLIYEDLQCPDCAVFRSMLDAELLPRYASRVRFEHRDFPLPKHAWARKAAMAARFFDEGQPGLGLEYRRYTMGHQTEMTAENFNDHLARFAHDHQVDSECALAALQDSRLAGLLEQDFRDGLTRAVAHTPTVLVNGRPFIETFTSRQLADAIDAELAAPRRDASND